LACLSFLQLSPSQKGFFEVSLHPQSLMSLTDSSMVNLKGLKSVPSWLPSQKGCFRLMPQLHHRYILSNIFGFSTSIGPLMGETGCTASSVLFREYSRLIYRCTLMFKWDWSSWLNVFVASDGFTIHDSAGTSFIRLRKKRVVLNSIIII
jgi:hypothetical protein